MLPLFFVPASIHVIFTFIRTKLSYDVPLLVYQTDRAGFGGGVRAKTIDALFFSATRDAQKGLLFLKVVNTQATAQSLTIELAGAGKVGKEGVAWTLAAGGPGETNSIDEPRKIVPVESVVKGLGKNFVRTFPAYSITVLQIKE